jgi:hypothetical protein
LRQNLTVPEERKIEGAQVEKVEESLPKRSRFDDSGKAVLIDQVEQMKIKRKRQNHLRHVDRHEQQEMMMGQVAPGCLVELIQVFSAKENGFGKADPKNRDL